MASIDISIRYMLYVYIRYTCMTRVCCVRIADVEDAVADAYISLQMKHSIMWLVACGLWLVSSLCFPAFVHVYV
jgi:hypothetical protein